MKPIRKDTPMEIFLAGLGICGLTGMFVWAVLGMFGFFGGTPQ